MSSHRGAAAPILIYGASIYGEILRDMIEDLGLDFAGYIDDWNSGDHVIGTFEDLHRNRRFAGHKVAIGIGYKHLHERREIAARISALGLELATFVHPRAYVAKHARIDSGGVVMAGAIVDTRVELGPLTVLWPGAVVNHHCKLAGNTFLSPSSVVCGSSSVGLDCFIGAGATVVDNVAVPAGTFIKAGTVYSGAGSPVRSGASVRAIRPRSA